MAKIDTQRRTKRQTDRQTNGGKDERTDGERKAGGTDGRTAGQSDERTPGRIDSSIDADQEYILLMGIPDAIFCPLHTFAHNQYTHYKHFPWVQGTECEPKQQGDIGSGVVVKPFHLPLRVLVENRTANLTVETTEWTLNKY